MKSHHFFWNFKHTAQLLLIVFAIQMLVQTALAGITLRSVSIMTAQSGSHAAAKPFGTIPNDVLIAAVAVRPDTASVTPPTGWTLVMQLDNPNATASSLAVYSKLATVFEPTNYLWTIGSNNGVVIGIIGLSGVATNDFISAFDGQNTPLGYQHTAPSVTPDVNKAMIMSWHSYGSSNPWSPPRPAAETRPMLEYVDAYTANTPGTSGISLEGNMYLQTNAAATGPLTATVPNDANIDVGNAITLALRPINNAPLLNPASSPTLGTVNEDPGPPSGRAGVLVSSLVGFSASSQVDGVIDTDSGALLGIAVIGTDTDNGTGYYSLDGGTNWMEMGAVDTTSAKLLAADADNRIYFQPGTNLNGTFTNAFTFRAWDRSAGLDGDIADTTTAGGITAFSTATDTISLKVNAVNDPPTAINLSADETYDSGIPLSLVPIVISDVDSSNVTASLTLSIPAAGSLSTATSGAVTSTYNASTGTWTAAGPIDDVNSLLAQVTFTSADNFNAGFFIATSVSDGLAPPLTGNKTMTSSTPYDPPILLSPTIDSGQLSFTGTGTAGMLYCLESSTNLDATSWISIQTNTAPFQFQIPATNSREFYRARIAP